ncbi:unnamed protein product [Bemisia tabaci]|uniref:POPDC1-3 domain-containing protein n=2 Tax=Bemisia tabaci TaxID=7038 RepID=A0A9P0F6L0_BEMTA|nr:PREDICTED: popeye domain-containing protein 3-like [Bemisia tabaci]CAH0394172.1 unnamed protein product [Bemisia tabaci]
MSAGGILHDRGATLVQVLPAADNVTWEEGPFNFTNYISFGTLGWCTVWQESQHWLFQVANTCFLVSYAVPTNRYGIVFMHSLLIVGFMFFTTWAWKIVCAPDVFTWNLCFLSINAFQLIYVIYQMRPVQFDPELEEVFQLLFKPFKVTRLQFKKLVSEQFAQIMSLHAGEAYAMQNLTKTDRLGLLLSGKVNVMQDQQFLHPINACEFLDSPEFESRASSEDKFKVSIVAATTCRYLYWQRSALEYLFIKETYLATVLATLVARDITTKLYAMNNKIITEKGSHLDIRLPSITSTLSANRDAASRALKKHNVILNTNTHTSSPNSTNDSRELLIKKSDFVPNGKVVEMTPVKEVASFDDIKSSHGSEIDTWLDASSKFNSCELIET